MCDTTNQILFPTISSCATQDNACLFVTLQLYFSYEDNVKTIMLFFVIIIRMIRVVLFAMEAPLANPLVTVG